MTSEQCNRIFEQVIDDYHQYNDIYADPQNPFSENTIEDLMYAKCWIDTMQWHMEDEIRNPGIQPVEAVKWKRAIDHSNQLRTDIVEDIDVYFLDKFKEVTPSETARFNTESPAGAIDRLSILALKIYHMRLETVRTDATEAHIAKCRQKLFVLMQQQTDLSLAIDELLEDIANGDKYMKVYRQMKMYNDPALNPVLYNNKK